MIHRRMGILVDDHNNNYYYYNINSASVSMSIIVIQYPTEAYD